jgi:Periplasmic binding protein domain
MMGELATQAAVLRTEGLEKTVSQHPEMKIVGKQTANWRRNEAIDLMNNWLVAGTQIDAVVTNNDEMAIGAILALQQAAKDPTKVVIAGIDATADGLAEMEKAISMSPSSRTPRVRARARWKPQSNSSKARRLSPLCGSRSSWSPRTTTKNTSTSDAALGCAGSLPYGV